jgi:orotate phosphoribosyltransferase
MYAFQRDFIEFAIQHESLKFGTFTLKSGRISPYFFNAGVFYTGEALARLGSFYTAAIAQYQLSFDCLFGPAYKGIPLVCATSQARYLSTQEPTPYAYNRKEVKDHGEGGQLVGCDLKDKKVLLIDDVITAGTAVRETIPLLQQVGAHLNGILVALDREEIDKDGNSALAQLSQKWQIPVKSIVSLSDILTFIAGNSVLKEHLPAIEAYQQKYCI